jgi:hypothetical protein
MCFVLLSCFDPETGGVISFQKSVTFNALHDMVSTSSTMYSLRIQETYSAQKLSVSDRPNSYWIHLVLWDLQIPTVKEEIRRYSSQYSARLSAHPNDLIINLNELPDNRRLRRHLPNDLPTRFLA